MSAHLGSGNGRGLDAAVDWMLNNRLAMRHNIRGLRGFQRTHFFLEEYFQQLPAANAVIALADASGGSGPNAAAFAAYTIANKNFELLGTNPLCTFATQFDRGAGILLKATGADADSAILLPHLDTNQTAWSATAQWASQKSPRFETIMALTPGTLITTAALTSNVVTVTTAAAHGIPTGAVCTIVLDKADSDYDVNMAVLEGTFTVTAASSTTLTYAVTHANVSSASIAGSATPAINYKQIVWAGLKKTNVETIATDNDQAYFRFSTANTTGPLVWQFVTSRAGVDVESVLPVACVPGTPYYLVIEIDDLRCPHIYINGEDLTLALSTAARAPLVTGIPLIPYIGCGANGTTPSAKAITVAYEACGRAQI